MKYKGVCPVCDREYHKKNTRTKHHIFPKCWYDSNVLVEVCHICHQVEFHNMFPMDRFWNERTCLSNWIKFCKKHNKDAYEIYPFLKTITNDYCL